MNLTKSVAALVIVFAVTAFGTPAVYAEQVPKAESTLAVAQVAVSTEAQTQSQVIEVTIRAGETLTQIAEANGTSVDALVSANSLANPDVIEPGQVLKVTKGEQRLTDYYGSLKAAAQAFIEPPVVVVAAPVATNVARTVTTRSATVASGGSSYYAGNGMWCTDYVHSRRPDVPIYGNAGYNWISAAQAQGRATGNAPRAGAVAVMSGHVAYVESVNADGTYVVSEMGWNYKAGNYNIRTVNPGAFGAFIY